MLDSHCHLNDDALFSDYKNIIKRAFNNGVKTLLVVGWDVESSKRAIKIAEEFDGVYAAVGIHPENLEGISEKDIETIKQLATSSKKVVAIGEIGLDYHWYKDPEIRKNQHTWFIKQINLANELNLPISIHAREASEDTYSILLNNKVNKGGVLHCYSGSVEMMKKFLRLGFYFGFDGPITFKNAQTPKECVSFCPIDKILTETDSPYLAPQSFRGKTNYPEYIPEIVKCIAELKDLNVETIEENISKNFKLLFHGEHTC